MKLSVEPENEESDFSVYRSTNKTKMPDDGLIESECARFKTSKMDFGIIHLSEIQRWMGISPAIQFEIFRKESEAVRMMEDWKKRLEEALFPIVQRRLGDDCPDVPEEFYSFYNVLKELIPDRHPGRLPTISIADPEDGIWVSSWGRTISAIQPIFIPTVRFDLSPPILYYMIPKGIDEFNEPSIDVASHAFMYAGFEDLGGVVTIPTRAKDKETVNLIVPDGDVPINDLSFSDFIYSKIIEDNLWKNRQDNPCIVSLGSSNSLALATTVEQLESLLESDFFVRFDL